MKQARCFLVLVGFVLAIQAAPVAGALAAPAETVNVNEAVSLVPVEYRHRLVQQLSLAEEKRPQWLGAIVKAKPEHREAVAFLLSNMPERDLKELTADFLLRNVELAYEARAATPWAAAVPQELFFNEVLPYANLNERRDDWRGDFYKRFMPLVKDCKSAVRGVSTAQPRGVQDVQGLVPRDQAAQAGPEPVRVGRDRVRVVQRAVDPAGGRLPGGRRPARVAGTPLWADGSGNHTWVEVWDKQWYFVGAAEPGPLNQTWFAALAAKSKPGDAAHGIYAASFRQTGTPFPLVWDPTNKDYPAVNVTRCYAGRRKLTVSVVGPDGKPAAGQVQVRSAGATVAQDTGERVAFDLPAGAGYTLDVIAAEGRLSARLPVELPEDDDRTAVLRLAAPNVPAGRAVAGPSRAVRFRNESSFPAQRASGRGSRAANGHSPRGAADVSGRGLFGGTRTPPLSNVGPRQGRVAFPLFPEPGERGEDAMTRRLLIRTVLFFAITVVIWAGSAWLDVATRTDAATPDAFAGTGDARGTGSAAENRYEEVIAFGGAVLVVVAFGLTIGSCRRHVGMECGDAGDEIGDSTGVR